MRANGFGNLRAIPALQRPVPIGFEMKRNDRVAGHLRQPDRARLRHPRRASRPVERERDRLALDVADQLQQRLPCAPR